MAGLNLDSLKNGLFKVQDAFKQNAANARGGNDYEEEYASDPYADEYQDDANDLYEEDEYEDGAYAEDEYEDEYAEEAYAEDEYEAESYAEDEYEDDPYASSDDTSNSNDGYAYQDEEDLYADEEEDGYNYDEPLSASDDDLYDDEDDYLGGSASDNGFDYDDEYDDEYEGENDNYYDEYEDDGYDQPYADEEGYGEEAPAAQPGSKKELVLGVASKAYDYVCTHTFCIILLLIIFPLNPIGIWLLWKKLDLDISLKSAGTALSAIWFVIALILCLTSGGNDDPVDGTNPPNFINYSSAPTATVAPSAHPSSTATTEPTVPVTTPNTNLNNNIDNNNTGNNTTSYVWTDNTGMYYHNMENCGGTTNASRITLSSATARGKIACPVCVGGSGTVPGTTTPTGTAYYATARGTWYHKDSSCQGMQNATVVTEANAIANGKTACPVCIGYYGTPGGKSYHTLSNCQGMQNAITKSAAEWEASGKTACTICVNTDNKVGNTHTGSTPTTTMVYATAQGTYFHTKSNCSGMKGASNISLARALSANKKMCPECVTPSSIMVFATPGGTYYHTKNNCSSMKNAQYISAQYAIQYGKTACPNCASVFAGNTTGNSTTTTGTTGTGALNGATDVYVYATAGGTYMHTKKDCTGMANAQRVTFAQATNAGKKVCPTCMTPKTLTVFARADGKWFHTNSTCQGMKDPVQVTAQTAMNYGKSACPVCAKNLSATVNLGNNAGTGNNNTSNNANNNNNNNANNNANNNTGNNNSYNSNTTGAGADRVVYVKSGKTYYHVAAKCTAQGISGAERVTLEFALGRGYKACPSCNPPAKIS